MVAAPSWIAALISRSVTPRQWQMYTVFVSSHYEGLGIPNVPQLCLLCTPRNRAQRGTSGL